MKHLFAQAVIIFSFFTLSSVSSAEIREDGNLAQEIVLLEANSYRVVTEFNVYAMQKDKKSEQRLFDVLATGDQLSSLFAEQSTELAPSWAKYRSFARANYKQAQGDTYIFNDMRALHQKLLTIISTVKKQVNSDLLPAKDLYRVNGVLLIEQLASEYLEMSAATFGAFGFAGSEQAIKIEVRSEAFEQVIDELNKLYVDDADKLKAIKKLALRWRFIKSTLLAYNQRSAPFAVARTVGYIRKQLAAI
ncbi:MAG: hypothetical protein KBT75_00920 [Oleispira antarctica]|uniref:Uncharacterized protein n=1 Tax=Oleispira antarctica RB-8 TaxID=698738 RepID=R4YMG1_OLEAN|nr:hypothetical protein [Oleispira antarctica]MBQ0791750.1 hypothetical protein [Oleispira antarctica]CCK74273.1 Hypothetical protein OLEAN_C00970 [Oleispira antarctica RB-8]|tara:strand:+ start:2476 stop:3219 length:744 start_codon:yes stop_codon:yes gene_type:complete